jgi:benzoyl-CoA reductase subunit C
MTLDEIAVKVRDVSEDTDYKTVSRWAGEHPDAPVVGYLPAYAPRELVYAAGGLAVGIWGGGITVEIVHGDAYYQSYICRLPRSVIDLAMQKVFEPCQGFIFPSICDVIRNLSGMWQILFPGQWVKYLDLPQNLDPKLGGQFYRRELEHLTALITGNPPSVEFKEKLREAIVLTNRQGALLERLQTLRCETPHKIPIEDYYYLFRSALTLHTEEHIPLIESYLDGVEEREGRFMDNIRVLVIGAFCEQPPIGLLNTIERAGCYIVGHDLLIGLHMFKSPLDEECDPYDSLVKGYVEQSKLAAFRYQDEDDRGAELVKMVQEHRADGVIFAAPSFCDPALLDRPILARALDREGIPYTSFQYSENTGQYQSIREQAGTFSDSVRLWT